MEHFWTWTRNGTPVVTTPDGVNMANEDPLPGILHDAAARNPVVIVDAATCKTFFSVNAMRMLDEAASTMADAGGELRIVITKPRPSGSILGLLIRAPTPPRRLSDSWWPHEHRRRARRAAESRAMALAMVRRANEWAFDLGARAWPSPPL